MGKQGINMSLFVDGMIVYVENLKESKNKTEQKSPLRTNEFNKITGWI